MRSILTVVISLNDEVTAHCYNHIRGCRCSINQVQAANCTCKLYIEVRESNNDFATQNLQLLLQDSTLYKLHPVGNSPVISLIKPLSDHGYNPHKHKALIQFCSSLEPSVKFPLTSSQEELSTSKMQFHGTFPLCTSN